MALETVESVVELLEDAVFELGSVVQQLTVVDVERSLAEELRSSSC